MLDRKKRFAVLDLYNGIPTKGYDALQKYWIHLAMRQIITFLDIRPKDECG